MKFDSENNQVPFPHARKLSEILSSSESERLVVELKYSNHPSANAVYASYSILGLTPGASQGHLDEAYGLCRLSLEKSNSENGNLGLARLAELYAVLSNRFRRIVLDNIAGFGGDGEQGL